MHPILITIGPISVPTYGFLFALGVLLGIVVSLRSARQAGLDVNTIGDFLFYMLICSLLGAKLLLFVTRFSFYLSNPGELKYLLTSGGIFYGGVICGLAFAVWFIRRHKLDFAVMADIIAPALALGHFFGRLGCFFAGCCYGREAGSCPIAVTFHDSTAGNLTGIPLHIPLFPTQLIEALCELLIFILLYFFLRRRKAYAGRLFVVYIALYSLVRFSVEYFRGDADRGFIFGSAAAPFASISQAQLISIAGLLLALTLHIVLRRRRV